MDPFVLIYYGVICAGLGWAAPWVGRWPVRLAAGAVTGVIAGWLLPMIRVAVMGY